MPSGPDSQHRRVIIGCCRPGRSRAQRRHRHRPGIVRVVLVRVTGCQQPNRALSLGWMPGTRSPAVSSCWASRYPVPSAPSIAQVRSGQGTAHASSRSACAAPARTRSSPSGSSAALIATAVCTEYLYLSAGGRHCRIEHRSARSGRPSALPATGEVVRHPAAVMGRGRPGRRSANGRRHDQVASGKSRSSPLASVAQEDRVGWNSVRGWVSAGLVRTCREQHGRMLLAEAESCVTAAPGATRVAIEAPVRRLRPSPVRRPSSPPRGPTSGAHTTPATCRPCRDSQRPGTPGWNSGG